MPVDLEEIPHVIVDWAANGYPDSMWGLVSDLADEIRAARETITALHGTIDSQHQTAQAMIGKLREMEARIAELEAMVDDSEAQCLHYATKAAELEAAQTPRPMAEAPRDGTPVLARLPDGHLCIVWRWRGIWTNGNMDKWDNPVSLRPTEFYRLPPTLTGDAK